MFGFLVGTLSLIGLIKVARWGRYGRHGGPRRWMLRRLFQHLDTTPGQEKVVSEVVDELQRKAWAARETFFSARGSFAKAVAGEHFDGAAVDASFETQQAAVEELKKAVREGLGKVHEALNPEQRKRLAELIEFGPGRMHGRCGGHFGHLHGMHRHGPMGGPSAVNL